MSSNAANATASGVPQAADGERMGQQRVRSAHRSSTSSSHGSAQLRFAFSASSTKFGIGVGKRTDHISVRQNSDHFFQALEIFNGHQISSRPSVDGDADPVMLSTYLRNKF